MLINRIQRSMEMTLEGVDTLDASLILEASGEFQKGVAELEKNLTGFIAVCKPFAALAPFVANLEKSLASLKSAPMDDISDKYSFASHFQILNPDSGDGDTPPETTISNIALEYPTYVAALRDGILEIAKWLEKYPDVFSVGKNGIVFSKAFRGVVANQEIKIKDFAQSGDEIIVLMSGLNDTSPEKTKLKSHYANIWKKPGLEPEKEDEMWNKFVAGIDTIGQGASKAHDSATGTIKGIKPPDEVQQSTKKGGGILQSLIGSLFGGKSDAPAVEPINQDPTLIVGESLTDEKGIFAMSFQDLQKLIASVIEFSGSSAAAGANALAGIDSHQKEAMEMAPWQVKFFEKVKSISPKIKDEEAIKILAAAEKSGLEEGDSAKIDNDKLKSLLMTMYKDDEEKVNAILVGLELGDAADDEEESDAKSPLDVITDLRNVGDHFKDEVIDIATEEELMDGEGEASPPNDPEAVDDVIEMVDDELDDDEQDELRDAFNSKNEAVLRENINRWAKLAGIIKG